MIAKLLHTLLSGKGAPVRPAIAGPIGTLPIIMYTLESMERRHDDSGSFASTTVTANADIFAANLIAADVIARTLTTAIDATRGVVIDQTLVEWAKVTDCAMNTATSTPGEANAPTRLTLTFELEILLNLTPTPTP